MSKYLDFIGEKVTKKENKEGYLILGAALGAVFLAKHFIHKKSSSMYFLENLKGKEDIDEFVQELGYPNDFSEDMLLDDENEFDYLDQPQLQVDPFSDIED